MLSQLAVKYTYTKFMRIVSTDAESKWDDICLPTLLVYQGGNLIHSFIRIQDSIGKNNNFDQDHLEQFLVSKNVLKK